VKITSADPARGILDFDRGLKKFSLERFPRVPELAPWVEDFWQVSWSLSTDEKHLQSNLSQASLSIAAESDGAWLYGVPGKLFVREIRGSDWVFGVKFRPGGFFPFVGRDVSPWTGKRVPLEDVWGAEARDWGRAMRETIAAEDRLRLSVALLTKRAPAQPARSTAMADKLIADRSILDVAEAARVLGLDERSLQRVFRAEIGLSPKQLLKRFRLQEAAERLLREPEASCADLALDLGYADQAHFTRDFKSVVGTPPEAYRRSQ
jgi:AraC-like DNA-binding protein